MINLIFEKQHELVIFVAIAFVLFVLYFVLNRAILSSRMSLDKRRRAISNNRGILIFLIFLSFLFIWSDQIYSTILTFAALAAAVAIAAKELLLCMAGSFYRAFARPFSVGDRIEINGLRGDVIDVGLLATQILEVGPGNTTQQFTGRTVSIPNSSFVLNNVLNETSSQSSTDFVLHVFSVYTKVDENWKRHRSALLESSQSHCGQYIDEATKHMQRIARRRSIEVPFIEPQINIKIDQPDEIRFIVRVTVPALLKGKIEQMIINSYLEKIWG